MTSNNIVKTVESDNAVFFRTMCECCHTHGQSLAIEIDEKLNEIVLWLYIPIKVCSFDGCDYNWWYRLKWRFKNSFNILFKGYMEHEDAFLMRQESLKGYIKALQEAYNKLEKYKNNA